MVTATRNTIQDDLFDFLQDLDQYGFNADIRQLGVAQDLILQLLEQDRLPDNLSDMGTLLAPVFAGNPQQQQYFYYLFEQWSASKLSREKDSASTEINVEKTAAEKDIVDGIDENNRQAKKSSLYKKCLICLLSLMIGLEVLFLFNESLKQWCIDLALCDKPVIDIPPETIKPIEPFENITTLPEAKTLLPRDEFIIKTSRIIPAETYQRLLISSLPLLMLLSWLFWYLYRRSLYLEQQSSRTTPEQQHLSIPPAQGYLYQQADIRRSFQRMRQHRLVPGKNPDIDKTVIESLRRCDHSVVYYKQRKVLPEHLLLLDKVGAGKHQMKLFDTMVAAMENEGLALERFYFHGDPRLCYQHERPDRWLSLAELSEQYRDYRLVIISDAERFFHPVSGLPASWVVDEFHGWQSLVLLTPKDFRSWGLKELSLHRQGFLVSPNSKTGVDLASRYMAEQLELDKELDVTLYSGVISTLPLPEILGEYRHRWLESAPPSPALFEKLLKELKAYLGDDGFLWLSTCAVYPSLHWDLTANLGLLLAKRKDGQPLPDEDEFLRLLRLPWFDHGFMPQYLRETLIAGMNKVDRKLVRELIAELLEKGELDKGLHKRLPVAKAGSKDWWLRLRALMYGVGKDSPLRDYVFMRFLMGRKQRLTRFKLPAFLQRFVRRFSPAFVNGQSGFGVVAGIVIVVALWWESGAWFQQVVVTNEMVKTPEMVVIPAGIFRMGDIQGTGRDEEKPVHEVTFTAPFAMGTKEITFAEYDAFAQATGRILPDDRSWGRVDRPVINVSWEDAKAYAQWLSEKTGKPYRLPTEAEWEYAARAGTETDYSWGNDIGVNNANCIGCGSQWDRQQTAPVGSFQANRFGLYDMHGNVWEWTEDCWNGSYDGAPVDGSAWKGGDCDRSVLRGGSWFFNPLNLRSSYRLWGSRTDRDFNTGFRLVQDLFIKREFTDPLRDGGNGPVMVTIPPGWFQMGDIQGGGHSDEKPVHPVVISHSFAIGKTEVTFDDYDRFARATGKELPKDRDWGRGDRPVIYVSWDDAKAYAAWLSEQTGKHYRLPTEAEWEYAARAGTVTAYHWGDKASHEFANYGKDECCDGLVEGKDQWLNTAPVGQFPANGFGLHDMHGNVYEWVEDCWNGSYEGAPTDGSAWKAGDCDVSVLRGGSWNNFPQDLRSSSRYRGTRTYRYGGTGFRLVQD